MTKNGKPQLPIGQLSVLSLCRLAEPIALTSVYPYLPEMIESFGVDQNDVGQWAGITIAVFSFSQSLTGLPWGSASDVLGRKPTLLFGLFVTMCATVMFGFSQSLPWAIVARAIAGAGSGTVGISRTTVAEMVSERELQPRAFSIMPLVWSIGSVIGPTFGGLLAKPAEHYPGLFGKDRFFLNFPFALPNLIAGVLFFFGVTTGILYLRETLETRRDTRDYGLVLGEIIGRPFRRRHASEKSVTDNEGSPRHSPHHKPATVFKPIRYRDVFTKQTSLNLVAYTILAFHSTSFDQLVPVFLHLPVKDTSDQESPFRFGGGLGLESGRIGLIFTVYAVVSMLCQFLVFPPMANRFGVLRCFQVISAIAPVACFLMPFTALLPTPLTQQIAVFLVMSIKCVIGVFSFPCSTILLTNSVPSLRLLGTLNGVATSISALGRGIGPALCGWLFTIGADIDFVILPWWFLALVAVFGHISTRYLVETEGPGSDADEVVAVVEAARDEQQETQPLLGPEVSRVSSRDYDSMTQERH